MNRLMGSAVGPRALIDGKEFDYFGGTSYYSLHADPRVMDAACAAIRAHGTGPGTTIDTPPMRDLLGAIAAYFGEEDARVVASGYLSDMMLLQALSEQFDVAFVDEWAHYSVYDGVRTTGKAVVSFAHLDAGDLRTQIQRHLPAGRVPLVLSDGVFPITGSIAPLPDYLDVLADYEGALLCIDDSHGVGVLGERGRGTIEYWGLTGPNRHFAATLSKAFGGLGGFVTGSKEFTAKVDRSGRISEGSSPLSTAAAAAAATGLRILSQHPELRQRLRENVARLRDALIALGLDVIRSPVPIVCVRETAGLDLARVEDGLRNAGIVVSLISARGYSDAPAVPALRIAVFSGHTTEQIERFVTMLRGLV